MNPRHSFFLAILICAAAPAYAAAVNEHTPVTGQGFGPIKIGMTLAEASKVAGAPIVDPGGVRASPNCFYGYFETGKESVSGIEFMLEDDRITTVEVHNRAVRTAEGAHVGMSVKELKKTYDGTWTPSENIYGNEGDYNILVPVGKKFGYMFYLDGNDGTVTSYTAGQLSSVKYVEGCA